MVLIIRTFTTADEAAVVALWRATGLTRPWNDPHADIARKQAIQPEQFLVGEYAALGFYERIGYEQQAVAILGRRLIVDDPALATS